MGNSAGGNAIAYLMASKTVLTFKKPLFQQAIISSFKPDLIKNQNLLQSYAIIEKFCVKFFFF